jgi:pyruvate formate lyase activating enzyme
LRLGDYLVPTTVDWPGKCAMIVWLAGCNLRCPFCHNAGIIPGDSGRSIRVADFKKEIRDSFRWVDGVVFSGGEPLLQPEAVGELASYAKRNGRGVLIDTNGTRPEALRGLLEEDLVDRVSLDMKSAPERYGVVTGGSAEVADRVLESLRISLDSGAEVEVRTTVVPGMVGRRDVEAISGLIAGCDVYYLQQFRNEGDVLDESLKSVDPPLPRELAKLGRIARRLLPKVGIKTREFGVQYL